MILNKATERSAASSIFLIIGFVLFGMGVGNLLAALVMVIVGGISTNDLGNLNAALQSSPTGWWALMLGQGVASFITFIASGMIYWGYVEGKTFADFNFKPLPPARVFFLVALIQLAFMPFNGWLQAVNQQMHLPEFLKGLEATMRQMEDNLAEVTKFMTSFDTIGQYLLAFLVIAVIAGVGEELIFRGLLQRKFFLATNNPHTAIWIAAFIFSAIHFQFYGFLPRLLLGAMFGYFYYFTGNLWVPIFAHIFNNGLAVTLLYLSKHNIISPEVEKMDNVPLPAAAFSLFLSLILFRYFKQTTESTALPT